MAKTAILFVCVSLIVITTLQTIANADDDWKFIKNDKGIEVYTKKLDGSDVDEFKGVCVIDASIDLLLEILRDVDSYPQWQFNCTDSGIIKKINEDTWITFFIQKAPWPVLDRDMVLRQSYERHDSERKAFVYLNATEEPSYPLQKGYVRITDLAGGWAFEEIEPGKTRVVYTIRGNPAGAISSSIANFNSRNIPAGTLLGMKREVERRKNIGQQQESGPAD